MDTAKLTKHEIRELTGSQLVEIEQAMRKEIAMLKINSYMGSSLNTGNLCKLRKNLARVMTVKTHLKKAGK